MQHIPCTRQSLVPLSSPKSLNFFVVEGLNAAHVSSIVTQVSKCGGQLVPLKVSDARVVMNLKLYLGSGDGQVVSVLAINSYDPSLNPNEVYKLS